MTPARTQWQPDWPQPIDPASGQTQWLYWPSDNPGQWPNPDWTQTEGNDPDIEPRPIGPSGLTQPNWPIGQWLTDSISEIDWTVIGNYWPDPVERWRYWPSSGRTDSDPIVVIIVDGRGQWLTQAQWRLLLVVYYWQWPQLLTPVLKAQLDPLLNPVIEWLKPSW